MSAEAVNPTDKFKPLQKVLDYDHGKVELLADLANEINRVRARLDELMEIGAENEDLQRYLWRTAEGEVIALHKLEDDHLRNIMLNLLNTGRHISKEIKAEARSRGIDVPTRSSVRPRNLAALLEPGAVWEERFDV